MQRLVPVSQFFSWLRRSGHIESNPASDLIMPRADRRLPESTLTATEMSRLLSTPDITKPLGLRDRAVLEVFYSCALRRNELIELTLRDVDFERGTVFVRCGKGAKDRYVPIGERALFWLRLLHRPHPSAARRSGVPRAPLHVEQRHADVSRLGLQKGASVPGRCRDQEARELSPFASHRRNADA
jgi:site-specific recombinase XerD